MVTKKCVYGIEKCAGYTFDVSNSNLLRLNTDGLKVLSGSLPLCSGALQHLLAINTADLTGTMSV